MIVLLLLSWYMISMVISLCIVYPNHIMFILVCPFIFVAPIVAIPSIAVFFENRKYSEMTKAVLKSRKPYKGKPILLTAYQVLTNNQKFKIQGKCQNKWIEHKTYDNPQEAYEAVSFLTNNIKTIKSL